jgi:hypothetical protein
MRSCPDCKSKVSFWALALPRFSTRLRCSTCSVELRLRGIFAWNSELAALVASLAIYGAIKGNVLESLAALPVMFVIFFIQYRFASIEAGVQAR